MLSLCPQSSPTDESANQDDPRVATVTATTSGSAPDIATLLSANHANLGFADEQHKDPDLLEITNFIQKEELPHEQKCARKIALQASLSTMEDDMCYVDLKQKHRKRVAVPRHLQEQILKESHAGGMGGHEGGHTLHWYVVGGGMLIPCVL